MTATERARSFVTPDGVRLAYGLYGDPRAILLLHGLGADRQMWAPQLARWPAEGFVLIAPDVRGHGRSQLVDPFRITDCAPDLDALLEHLRIPEADVVGVSMGGLIAQQLAVDFPSRVSRLVVSTRSAGSAGRSGR